MNKQASHWVNVNSEHRQMMKDCMVPKRNELLEPWQSDFIEDIMEWTRLSEKQVRMLENIWEIATAEG